MKDGLVNKCKDCSRKETADRIAQKSSDPEWAERELTRQREKMRSARAIGTVKPIPPGRMREYLQRSRLKHPQRNAARRTAGRAKIPKQPCEVCGRTDAQKHHDDHLKPLEVRWLCPKHHAEADNELRRQRRLSALPDEKVHPLPS